MDKKKIYKFIPPIIWDLKKSFLKSKDKKAPSHRLKWSGNYKSWEEAESKTIGYNANNIFKKTAEAILKVKHGEAKYERDSVLFDKPEYSWPLLATLLKISVENNNTLNILDFGGSLGSSYFQNKDFLTGIRNMSWSVVEQEHYTSFGNEKVADDVLRFYFNIEDCIIDRHPQVLLLSGVVQYLSEPYQWLEKFKSKNFEYIIFDRTSFIEAESDRLTIQNVPANVYEASYPAWFFNYGKFVSFFEAQYALIADFESHHGFVITLEDNIRAYYKGLILKRK